LSGYHPIQALKNKQASRQTSGLSLRRGLVVVQFCISQVLIIGTIVVASQMDYFRSKSLGFDKEAVMTVNLPGTQQLNLETMRTQLMAHQGVENVSFSNSSVSSSERQRTFFTYKGDISLVDEFDADIKFGDAQYLETYKLTLLAGRNLLKGDTIREYIVNESLIKKLGIHTPEEAIGKYISLWGRVEAPIVGVVQDFHMASFRESIGACIITTLSRAYGTANIKLQVSQMQPAVSHVEKIWTKAYPEHVFGYEFIDQTIANFYRDEQKTARLFEVFAGIAIFIGCLGLFGLISFLTTQRTKEVGIRKVLGASMYNITLLFFKEFALLVLLAFLIASPIAYYLMHGWLENFEYSIDLSVGFFLISGVASLLIAALTVGYQTFKAALANPVKSLRSE
jgi:ABC-type antimicrobial peptide transport system permease subunit